MSKPSLSDAVKGQHPLGIRDVEKAKDAATGRQDEPTKRLNVNVPESLYDEFKDTCDGEGRTMSWVVNQMLEEYVQERG